MRFALIDNLRVEAKFGLKGICPGCGQPVVSKCGTVRVHHWAHQRTEMCDRWWESEEEWHRSWKDNFPRLWQECFMPDILTGEKHIADVRTDHGLVIEFQHSHLKPEERIARENFYPDLVWIVDGTRLIRDYRRFIKGQSQICASGKPGIFYVYDPDKCFPAPWINSSVPVIFDFRNAQSIDNTIDLREPLHCLFPVRVGRRATLARIPRSAFIKATINGEWSARVRNIMKELLEAKEDWEHEEQSFNQKWKMHELQMRNVGKGQG